MPSSPPARTIEAAKRGDPQAMEEILKWFVNDERFFLRAYRILGNYEEARDVIQESAIQILENISQYDQDRGAFSCLEPDHNRGDFPGWCDEIVVILVQRQIP